MKYLCLWCLCLWLPGFCMAQSAATVWYPGNGTVLDFGTSPVRVGTTAVTTGPLQVGATNVTDALGRVRLSVTGGGMYGANGQLLPNGNFAGMIIRPDQTIVVPAPGSGSRYYVFYLMSSQSATGVQLTYSVVDLAANGGTGAVLSKDQPLRNNVHGSFGVVARCSDDFWVVNEVNQNQFTGSDQITAYRVTAAGIAAFPIVSEPVSMGFSYNYAFSPAGDQLLFSHNGNQTVDRQSIQGVVLATFNQATGLVTNPIRLGTDGWEGAFSASGRRLYLVNRDSVVQYDVSSRNAAQIRASRTVLYAGPQQFRTPRLAPDGRIYLATNTSGNSLAVIATPELNGLAAGFTPAAVSLTRPVWFLPSTASQQLFAPPVPANAGPDLTVCEGQPIALAGSPVPGFPITWSPATYLSSATSTTPTFRYTGPALTDTLRLAYTLAFFDGTCTRQDVMNVTVLPTPPAPVITGSPSVCPGVVGVEYRVPARPGYTYQWTVSGGTLAAGQGTPTVRVNWGSANAGAYVQVVLLNTANCPGPPARLPVRVNVRLQTETPQGPAQVCLNQCLNVAYQVPRTSGSVYTWAVRGGTLTTGQGTAQVTVDWQAVGQHAIWIEERSTTAEAVCYGASDTLRVAVFQDSTRGQLTAASIGPDTDAESTLTWAFSQPLSAARPLQLWRRAAGTAAWQLQATLASTARAHRDSAVAADEISYEYMVRGYNACDEVLETVPHRTVLLTTQPAAPDSIGLAWTPYLGWPTGVTGYELWRKLDAEPAFTRLRQLGGSVRQVRVTAVAGLAHQYRIRALTTGAAAWSNTVDLAFEHALVIPNVFTPNGDGRNDTFSIPRLLLYPDNDLVVFSRWGQKVYEQHGYRGDWAGGTMSGGVYYYRIRVAALNTTYKGWVEIVK